jgi:hypothetical protein
MPPPTAESCNDDFSPDALPHAAVLGSREGKRKKRAVVETEL